MTLLVYAGSSQLAALPLLVAGAPFWVILATGFCVNLRFVVFSLHLRPYLLYMPRWRRLLHGYLQQRPAEDLRRELRALALAQQQTNRLLRRIVFGGALALLALIALVLWAPGGFYG